MKIKKEVIKKILLIAVFLLQASCSHQLNKVPSPDYSWPFYQGNVLRNGYVETEFKPQLGRKWTKFLGSISGSYAPQEYSSPVADDNRIFTASLSGKGVRAFNENSGILLWYFKVEKGVEGSPALYEGRVYFGGNDGYLYAVNSETGLLVWKFNADAEILSSPVADEGIIYFSAANDILYALDAKTSKLIWRYREGRGAEPFSVRATSSPAVKDGFVYAGFSNGTVAAIGAYDGSLLWKKRITGNKSAKFRDVDSSPVIDEDRLYISSYDAGLFALNVASGEIIWGFEEAGSSKTVVYDKESIYYSDNEGRVYSIAKKTGIAKWKFNLEEGVATTPIVIGNYLSFGSSYRYLYLLDKFNGKEIDRFNTPSGFSSSPIFYKGSLLALSNTGYLYSLGR
ncbi:MAG: PQQ-binding-like beta-propeller repeat protein [bacterium]|nr:PQQ-binding-like beta-propeller repeat protein [bacterium]